MRSAHPRPNAGMDGQGYPGPWHTLDMLVSPHQTQCRDGWTGLAWTLAHLGHAGQSTPDPMPGWTDRVSLETLSYLGHAGQSTPDPMPGWTDRVNLDPPSHTLDMLAITWGEKA
ncbi:hypothetical protein ACOMHN_004360 [Nucella lapillus]